MTTLYLVCGEPGVGKSRVAETIAEWEDATRYATDEIRKQVYGPNPSYDREESQGTYDEMFRRAEVSLEAETSVVLDATFMLAKGRMRALELSIIHDVSFHPFRVECEPSVVKDRIRARQQEGSTDSDAGIEVYQSIRDRFEPVADTYHIIDNSGPFEETLEQL